jgi:protein phosphatase
MVVHDASPEAARGWVAGEAAGTLLVLADGMGGQGSGDVASRVAVNTIAGYLLNVMPWATARVGESTGRESVPSLVGVREQLSSALVAGDSTVKAAGVESGSPRMGTTLTMALVHWPILYVAHVGDTRCYLWRRQQLSRLTTDHTVAQQIAEFSPEPVDPASTFHNMLWNSLGGSEQLPKPQVVKAQLDAGDLLLLCSDGLTKHVTDAEIAGVLASPEPNAARCARLVDRANAAGGTDNVTVVIATAVSV